MFCTTCATFNHRSPDRCSNCGAELSSPHLHVPPAFGYGRPRRQWAIARLPLLLVVALLAGFGVRQMSERRDLAESYRAGEQLLIAGDLDGANEAFAGAKDYRNAEKRRAEVAAMLEPYQELYRQASESYEAGRYDDAITVLDTILADLPDDADALALMETVRSDRLVALRHEADDAEHAQDWLAAEHALTAILIETPDDAETAARLDAIRGEHAPLVYSREGGIYLGSPDGSTERVVLEGMNPSWPIWNPGRTQIAFVDYPPDRRSVDGDLYVVNPDGSGLKLLSSAMIPFNWPNWSPDGTRLVYTSAESFSIDTGQGFISIHSVDVATGVVTRLTGRNFDFAASPTWSPNGDRLAFVERIYQSTNGSTDFIGGDVYVMDLATGHIDDVSGDLLQDERAVAWSPTSDRLAIVTRPSDWSTDQVGGIFVLDMVTKAIAQVPTESWRPGYPTWSPDGSRLAFIESSDSIKIWSDAGVEWIRLTTDVQQNLGWSPDGQSVFAPAATLVEPSYLIPVGSDFGSRTQVELTFDSGNGPSGPPVWGARTTERPPAEPGGTGLDPAA